MTKTEALQLIDVHKNQLIDPVAILQWTWLRVIIHSISTTQWDVLVDKAEEIMSQ